MPIYEYKCDACGVISECIQKISDPPLSKCESCGGTLTKLISNTSFVLKGGGWYKDGYSGSSSAPSSGTGGVKSSAPSATSESSSKDSSVSPKADAPKADTPKPSDGGGKKEAQAAA